MLKACCECIHLSSVWVAGEVGGVECRQHPTQRVADPSEYIKTYVCDNFQPKFLANPEPRMLAALQFAKEHSSQALQSALTRWFSGPPNDVNVETNRGLPLLSLADGGLDTFEHDQELKSYEGSNHVFADVFGSVDIQWPIISYLSSSNPPGVRVETLGDKAVSVIQLGRPYSLAEVTAAFSFILSLQGIRLVRPWFRRYLRSAGVDPEDPSFASFRDLPDRIEYFLTDNRDILVQSWTAVFVSDCRLDLEPIGRFLGIDEGEYGVLWCDARDRFHLTQGGQTKYEFAGPSEVGPRLTELGVRAVLAAPESYHALWSRLTDGALAMIPIGILFIDSKSRDWYKTIHCFPPCHELELQDNHGSLD